MTGSFPDSDVEQTSPESSATTSKVYRAVALETPPADAGNSSERPNTVATAKGKEPEEQAGIDGAVIVDEDKSFMAAKGKDCYAAQIQVQDDRAGDGRSSIDEDEADKEEAYLKKSKYQVKIKYSILLIRVSFVL